MRHERRSGRARLAVCGISLVMMWTLAALAPNSASAQDFVRIRGEQFVYQGQVIKLKGTNYYPRQHMWGSMWSSWDWPAISTEVPMMKNLGLNCIRILVPYSNGGWSYNPSATKLQQLEDLVNLCGANGIKCIVTLFDWETSFPAAGTATETNHYTYVTAIVNRLKNNPHVFLWDVKNEPDHPDNYGKCDCNPGACGNWDCNPTKRDQIVSWLGRMCNKCRQLDSNHYATAGMRWWANLPDVLSFCDVAIFHSYWPNIYSEEIPQTRGYMGGNQKPIIVEEWGWPSHPTPCLRDGVRIYDYNEAQQLDLYKSHLRAIEQYGIAGGLQWMTFDAQGYFNDETDSFEDYFGLWKYDQTLKPAAIYYRDHMLVPALTTLATRTTALRNPSFEDNGGLLTGWETAWVSGETVDVPPWDNTNQWGPRTTYGTHFAGKITNGLAMNFYLGQVVAVGTPSAASLKTTWQLGARVQMRCLQASGYPTGVHQVWDIGWNNDGSIPVGMMFCDNYRTVVNINGNFTGNDAVNFYPTSATGMILGVRNLRGIAVRAHLYNDGQYIWTLNNIDNVSFAASMAAPVSADLDDDGDVDGVDFGIFAACFNGANPTKPGCAMADLNQDSQVDGVDYGYFASCFNGSNNPPPCQ